VGNPLSALIIEDSPSDAKLIAARLSEWGYEVQWVCVADPVGMQRALASRVYDVVISDGSLPSFSGLEALAVLKESKLDVPFIIVSGTVNDDLAVETMRHGAHDYISKDNLGRIGAAIQREVAQARLRAQRAREHEQDERFFSVTPDLFCVADFDGQFKRVNPAWQTTLGWTREELCSDTRPELLHPDDRAASLERRARILAGDEQTQSWEARYLHKDGSYRYLQWTATPFFGERVLYAAARDVTERRSTEDALRASQARFARLGESGIIAIAVADLQGKYHEVNEAYAALCGYSREELLSGAVTWVAQTPSEWQETDEAATTELVATGVASPWEKELFRKDGSRVPVLLGVAMLDSQRCIVFVADLSHQKRAEAALRRNEALLRHSQKMEALGQLAAGVAHEINTPAQYVTDNLAFLQRAFRGLLEPLRLATGLLDEARVGKVPDSTIARLEAALEDAEIDFVVEQAPRALEQSLDGIRRVSSIVAAMKGFSHPSSAQKEPADLREIIETTLNVSRNRWKYVADVTTEVDPDLPFVPCLRDELSQVILNVIVNAADSISDRTQSGANGKGTITVTARSQGEWAELRVGDTGAGIPEGIRSQIFDPFFTTKPVGKGTGQGLAIAHAVIVDKHGGEIFFETDPNQGSTFVIRIPMKVGGAVPAVLSSGLDSNPSVEARAFNG
jgi:two-component system NtrC family sensor kinase